MIQRLLATGAWIALLLASSGCATTVVAPTGTPSAAASLSSPSSITPSSLSASSLSPPSVTPSSVSPSTPGVPTIQVAVAGRTVTPAPTTYRVPARQTIRLVVTSTTANQVHVHGLDVERDLPAGTPVTLDLRFTDPGVYPVETHRPELLLLRLLVE